MTTLAGWTVFHFSYVVIKKDILVVQGDWNAKVGEDAYQNWDGTCGKYCNITSSEIGLRLLEFASYNNLILANTLGPHKLSRRVTWQSPNGEHHTTKYTISW